VGLLTAIVRAGRSAVSRATRARSTMPFPKRSTQLLLLLSSSFAGVALGITGDYLCGRERFELSTNLVLSVIVASPFVVTFGGNAVGPVFAWMGILFWPVYIFLSWWLFRQRTTLMSAAVAAGIVFWCAQGFFMILHRYARVMSV
jgi:hypothetical protein